MDKRPHPVIVADKYNFSLQRYEKNDAGKWLYSVHDWIAGITTSTPRQTQKVWSNVHLKWTLIELPYQLEDGREIQRPFVDAEGLYQIAAYLRVTKKRPILQEVKDYLAAAGVFVDEARRKPDIVSARLKGKIARQQLTDAIVGNLVPTNSKEVTRHIANVTDREYEELLGGTKRQIVTALNMTKAERAAFRDQLGILAIKMLDLVETSIAMNLEISFKKLTRQQQMDVVDEVLREMAPSYKALCRIAGVDRIRNERLLSSGEL